MDRICVGCGKPFTPWAKHQLRCTSDCGRKRLYPPRICKSCKCEFKPTRSFNLYCSKKCRNAHHNSLYQRSVYVGLSTGTVGAIGELRVASDLLAKGVEVFRALSPSCSCDLAVLKNGMLKRIEVRTAYRQKDGTVRYCKVSTRADILARVLPDEIIYEDTETNVIISF